MRLFRQQAIDHQNRLLGEVFLVSPLPWRVILALPLALLVIAALVLTFGTASRAITAGGVLRDTQGQGWQAMLSVPSATAMQLHTGLPVQLSLIADPASGGAPLDGTISRIDAPDDAQTRMWVLLDPLTPSQRMQGVVLRPDRPVSARILLTREPLWQSLTGSAADGGR